MKIFLTGGEGRLGTEFKSLLPNIIAPKFKDLDILNFNDDYINLKCCSNIKDVTLVPQL